MTFLDKETELRHYWAIMNEGWARFLANPNDPELDNIVDELDLLRENTEWPMLRALCTRALMLDDKLRQPLLAAEIREAL